MTNKDLSRNQKARVIVTIVIMFAIAAIHGFRVGSYLNGDLYILYYSYASDFMLPFGSYFMLSMNEIQFRFLRNWYVKVAIVFSVMTFSELMQYFDIYLFGVTFDWIDILMYGVGVLVAACVDKLVFDRYVPLWKYVKE